MKNKMMLITFILLSHMCSGGQVAQSGLPDQFMFERLPSEIQVKVFEEYLKSAKSLDELNRYIKAWKFTNKEIFQDILNSSVGMGIIAQQKERVLRDEKIVANERSQNEISKIKNYLVQQGFADYAELVNANLKPVSTKNDIQKNAIQLKINLTNILTKITFYERTNEVVQKLLDLGAGANGIDPEEGTPLCGAILGVTSRMNRAFIGQATLPNFNEELEKLKILIGHGASPSVPCKGMTLIQQLNNCLSYNKQNALQRGYIKPFEQYVSEATKILQSKKSFFGFGKKK